MDKSGGGPIFVRGSGSEVEDINGKKYLDFNSGQMCAALGHNHPTITAAIKHACDTLIHAHSSHFNVPEIELAERLGKLMPEPLKKSMFLQSGADANEAAINIARKFTRGFEVASPHIGFHGMSDTTRALTFAGWHAGYGPLAPGTMAMVAPYCYRCPLRQTFPDCEYACLDTSFELIDAQTTSRPAAVLTRAAVQRRRRDRATERLARGTQAALRGARDAADPRRGADRPGQARRYVRVPGRRRRARHRHARQALRGRRLHQRGDHVRGDRGARHRR